MGAFLNGDAVLVPNMISELLPKMACHRCIYTCPTCHENRCAGCLKPAPNGYFQCPNCSCLMKEVECPFHTLYGTLGPGALVIALAFFVVTFWRYLFQ